MFITFSISTSDHVMMVGGLSRLASQYNYLHQGSKLHHSTNAFRTQIKVLHSILCDLTSIAVKHPMRF